MLLCPASRAGAGAESGADWFERRIRPILVERCQSCHGEKAPRANLSLTSRQGLLRGGAAGPAVVPGRPEASLLVRAVERTGALKMPPSGKLPDAEVAVLREWVSRGAPWPEPRRPSSAAETGFAPTPAQRRWWAFQPLRVRRPPESPGAGLGSEIDRFLAEGHRLRRLLPVAAADRRTLIRRVTFDLTGLPPTPEDVSAFLADSAPGAFERIVDRLLASPAYGERYARHWLDVVRYADYHDGNPAARDLNCEPKEAWRYRDWVVRALNQDLPFDRFITHQLAGDLLPDPGGREFYTDGLVATTFLTNGAWDRGDADKEKMVSDMVDDQIDTIGKAFLGLTLGCARCHDHKFDPVSQRDYYALAGIFYSTRILKELGAKGGNYTLLRTPLASEESVRQREEALRRVDAVRSRLAELEKTKPGAVDPERVRLRSELEQLQAAVPAEPGYAEAAREGGTPGGLFPRIGDVPIHVRGSYTRLGEVVPRGFPAFLVRARRSVISGSGRRELAAWIASPDHPLTARVIVNRVWQWHFGTGLVRTANNFGLLSEPPSHLALLDWLAASFIEEGWSLKSLHRRIILTNAYRRRSRAPADQVRRDPDNRWLARFSRRRLQAEEIRDAHLAVSGGLDAATGGPASPDVRSGRRSLYVQTARWDRSSFAYLFDAANPDASVESRSVSTVAPQALYLMNHPFVHERASRLAARLLAEPHASAEGRLARGYLLLYGREPEPEEVRIGLGLVESIGAEMEGWTDLAHVLLCSNEFVHVD